MGPKRLMFLKNSLWDDDAATHFQLGWEGMSWRFWNTSAFIEVSSLHKGATKKRGVISESVTPQWNQRNRYHTHLYSCILSHLQPKSSRLENIVPSHRKQLGWNYKPSIVGFRSHLSVDSPQEKKKRLTIVLPQPPRETSAQQLEAGTIIKGSSFPARDPISPVTSLGVQRSAA